MVERNSFGKEFQTLVQIKVVDFKPKFKFLLRGTSNLLVPLKQFTLLRTTNKLRIYPSNIPFTALQVDMSWGRRSHKIRPYSSSP